MRESFSIVRRLVLICKFTGIMGGIAAASFLVLLFPLLARDIHPPCFAPTSYHIARMHWIEKRGEMEWSGEVENAVEHLQNCRSNVDALVQRLLADKSGTIVSLGMDIVVRESLDDGDQLLLQYASDKRWNHNMTYNDEYSRLLLALWKMKRGIQLTEEDGAIVNRWPPGYAMELGVTMPNP